jgi:hypothetical protein
MARIKLGPMVSDLRGSVGAASFSHTGGGLAVRSIAGQRRVLAARQLQVQSWAAYLSGRWSHDLSDSQRAAWRAVAGSSRRAQQSYIGGNIARLNAGQGVQDDGPVDTAPSALISALVQATAPAEVFVYYTAASLLSGTRLYVYASKPRTSARTMTPMAMTFLGVSPDGQVSPYDVGPALVAKYGDLTTGDWVSLFVKVLRDDGGILGPGLLITYPQGEVQPAPPVVTGDFVVPTITPLNYLSIGVEAAAQAAAAPASAAWGTNNLAEIYPFVTTRSFTIQTLFWFNGATLGANVDVGIYDSAFGRLRSTGAVGQVGINTLQLVAVTPLVLAPGRYYLAISLSLSTGTIFQASLTSAARTRYAGVLEQGTAHPLPATLVPIPTTRVGIQLVGASELAQIF